MTENGELMNTTLKKVLQSSFINLFLSSFVYIYSDTVNEIVVDRHQTSSGVWTMPTGHWETHYGYVLSSPINGFIPLDTNHQSKLDQVKCEYYVCFSQYLSLEILVSKTRVTRVQTRINDFHTVTKLFDAPTFIKTNKKIPAGQIISRRLPSSRSGSRLDLTWLEERGSKGRGNRWFVILIKTNWNIIDM